MTLLQATLAALLSLGASAASAEDPHAHQAAVPASDSRVVLELSPAERALVLEEMHQFLGGIQQMTSALGRQDMPVVAEAARGMGQKLAHTLPPALGAKLPQEFRQLGSAVHRDFDQIALDADSLQDVSTSLNQMSSTLKKCVSCHATYQIRTPAFDGLH
jgi:hypothetical protein